MNLFHTRIFFALIDLPFSGDGVIQYCFHGFCQLWLKEPLHFLSLIIKDEDGGMPLDAIGAHNSDEARCSVEYQHCCDRVTRFGPVWALEQ